MKQYNSIPPADYNKHAHTKGSLVRSILVAIFLICLVRFNRCSTCTALVDHPVRPFCFAVGGRPTRRHYQHNVL